MAQLERTLCAFSASYQFELEVNTHGDRFTAGADAVATLNIPVMSSISIHTSPQIAHPIRRAPALPETASSLGEILAPIYEAAHDSPSLVASRQPVTL